MHKVPPLYFFPSWGEKEAAAVGTFSVLKALARESGKEGEPRLNPFKEDERGGGKWE